MKLSDLHEAKPTIEYSPKARKARTTIQWPGLNPEATDFNDEPYYKGHGEVVNPPWNHEVKSDKFRDPKRNLVKTVLPKPTLNPRTERGRDIVGSPSFVSPDQVTDSGPDDPLYGEFGPNPMFRSRSEPTRRGDLKRQVKSLEKVFGKKAYACEYEDGKTGASTKPCPPGKEIKL